MYTKHNEDNAKLRQRKRIQTNFMTDSIRTFIYTNQTNTKTQPKQPNQPYQRGFD